MTLDTNKLIFAAFRGLFFCKRVLILISAYSSIAISGQFSVFLPTVEVEEVVYSYSFANNGAGPLWDYGSSNIVSLLGQIFVSGVQTLIDAIPQNNVMCNVWKRGSHGWELFYSDIYRTREPCPLVTFQKSKKVFISTNPTLIPPNMMTGPSLPTIVEFVIDGESQTPINSYPVWRGSGDVFSEHSYRSFSADGDVDELILFNNVEYSHAEWSFQDYRHNAVVQGQLKWPWGSEYEIPKFNRICYPNVVLRNRAVHFVGVSDIEEPDENWRRFKYGLTGNKTDYVFRRLFYTWNADIARNNFSDWLEISSRESTGGWITPGDLWLDDKGDAHIVWAEVALDPRLRDRFFPEQKQRWEMNYAVVHAGKVVFRKTFLAADEGEKGPIPRLPRFHVTPDGRLFVFFYVNGTNESGAEISENRLIEIYSDGSYSQMIRVPLVHPLENYMTATVRAGSAPSFLLDLIGTEPGHSNTIRYARVRLN
ncbi:MAG: hypothetical protein ACM3X0_09590 [Bacteroidota bacterium]